MRTVLSIVALVALAGGPAWAGSAREAIDAANQKFEAVFSKGDAAGVAQLYAEDAVLLPPGELRVEGRPAIEAYWKGTIDAGFKEITLKAGEVFEGGGAATRGRPVDDRRTDPKQRHPADVRQVHGRLATNRRSLANFTAICGMMIRSHRNKRVKGLPAAAPYGAPC